VGEKTAARLAFHILRAAPEDAAALAAAITDVKQKIRLCAVCCDLTESDPCNICGDARRDGGLICVVAQPQDVVAVERTGGYRGRYHVLHGLLSPLDGIGPDDLRVAELLRRCGDVAAPVSEVILATSSTVEGEATAVYLAKLLRPLGVRTSRIATGVPIGGELEYADQLTLARAIDGRREM
jgi:recombination protein RecR